MRKLLTIFLVFSLLITIFTMNTFAEGENDGKETSEPQSEVLDDRSATGSQDGLESISQNESPDTQEVLESQSEELLDYTVTQEENGNVVLVFNSKEYAEAVEYIYFEEVSKIKAGSYGIYKDSLIFEENKVTVTYNIISNILQLKNGSTYKVYILYAQNGVINEDYREITLTKGVEDWEISARVDTDGNLIISSTNSIINNNIISVRLSSENYEEGYDTYISFDHEEIEHTDEYVVISGDYIKTYKLLKDVNYNIEIVYSGVDGDQSASKIITVNPVKFNFDQMIGPELTGRVDDGILYIESKDNNPEGYEFLRLYYNYPKEYGNSCYFEVYKNGEINRFNFYDGCRFNLCENSLLINLLDFKFSKDLDINDNHKLYLRVPGKGLSEITFAINEDSMKLDSATITQDEIGNIIISANPSLKLESVNSIEFFSLDLSESNKVKYYDYFTDIYDEKTGNLVIPYSYIKASNLKGDEDYRVFLWYDDSSREISSSYRLNKGSERKNVPQYSVSENNKGDIVITVDDPSFLDYKIDIRLKDSEGFKYIRFKNDDVIKDLSSKTITVPYDLIKKSQLSKEQYDVEFEGDDFYAYFFRFYVPSTIEITRGSELEPIPEFTIEQKDNGDIVLSSKSQELINHIEDIIYSKPYIKAGPNAFLENSLIKGDNELVIPYQVVKYSRLEPGITYTFKIEFDDDSVFYYDERSEKELYIKTGSMLLNSEKMSIGRENNVVCINFENQDDLKKLENETYLITYHVDGSVEKETAVSKNSLVFDYSNNKVYIINELKGEEYYMLNLMDNETCLAYGFVYSSSMPLLDIVSINEKLYLDKIKKDAASYIQKLYPETGVIVDDVYFSEDFDVLDSDVDKYFKVYGLSLDNAFVVDVSMCAAFRAGGLWSSQKVPYDYPNEFVEVKLTLSLEQMAKLGITKENYSTQEIVVLREHNGEVTELPATLEAVKTGETIISFKVKFKTDKMSLFSVANKNSIVKPSSGSGGSSSTSTVTPARKPVVNTAAK